MNLPRAVGYLIAINAAVFALQNVVPWRWANWIVTHLGFVPMRYAGGPAEWDLWAYVGPITHQFLHGGVVHILVNMVMLAAFGSGVARTLGSRRMLVMYLISGLAGALAHWFVYPMDSAPVVGASGAISGLFGMVLRLLARHPHGGGLSRIWPVALIWVGIAVFTGIGGMPGAGDARVAWAAHLGGFAVGFLAFDLALIGFKPWRVK
ncbi:rhomboid family intramembrane serine protease [Limimonas halophila]|uniref:rhomboid family intramembrane serine protease n=1 Tax=Limimonas halophila TaxID=1082479 RepID=UPI00115FB2C7|nr:rhomboid family intramembrane serine protease [Limimonas halophila]